MERLVQQYYNEIKWRDEDYVPKTMSEHLQVSMESIACIPITCAAFVGMGDIITKETLDRVAFELSSISNVFWYICTPLK